MNDSHEQPKQEKVSTDEDASKSTPSPTPPGDSAPTNLICSFCDTKLPLDKYKKCPCKTAFYCMNASCQKEHWKVHKTEHRKIQKMQLQNHHLLQECIVSKRALESAQGGAS